MTTQKEMNLPDVLNELAQRLPERVQWMNAGYDGAFWMVYLTDEQDPDGSGFVSLGHPANPNQSRLEEALREECQTRRWPVEIHLHPYGVDEGHEVRIWTGYTAGEESTPMYAATAPTPAHTFSLALLRALS